MHNPWCSSVVTTCLLALALSTAAWSAPMAADDSHKSASDRADTNGSAQTRSTTGALNADHSTSTGNKSMDLLLNSKMPAGSLDVGAGAAAKGDDLPMGAGPSPMAATGYAPSASQSREGTSTSLKQWVRETGTNTGDSRSPSREVSDETSGDHRTGSNRAQGQGHDAADSEPGAFGKVFAFIRENRMTMLMVCALVLMLAGVAFVYSSKASSASRR